MSILIDRSSDSFKERLVEYFQSQPPLVDKCDEHKLKEWMDGFLPGYINLLLEEFSLVEVKQILDEQMEVGLGLLQQR